MPKDHRNSARKGPATIEEARSLLASDPAAAWGVAKAMLIDAPDEPAVRVLAARARAALGESGEALAQLEGLVQAWPHMAEAWRALADVYGTFGDSSASEHAHSRAIVEAVYDPILREAATALQEQNLPVAERLLKAHLAQHPTDVAAMRLLAELAGRLGRNLDAETLLRRALELFPSFSAARYNLAIVLHRQHRAPEALIELERLLDEEPGNPAYRNLLGAVQGGVGAYEAALVSFETALQGRPNNPSMWMSYGHTLKTLGRRDESIAAYRRSLRLLDTLGEAWWSLANLKTVRLSQNDIETMEGSLEKTSLSPDDRFHIHFALGKAYEDYELWDRSFYHYAEGNRLRRARIHYDPGEIHSLVERSQTFFTSDFFEERVGWGAPSPAPIFVLGMPRSGSTLIEQILASHSLVEGTRELPDIQALAHRLSGRRLIDEASRYPEALAELEPATVRALGEEYLDRVKIHRKTDRPYFVDKMPNNWVHVGLIRLILPNAKIIDARRHPLACCFSNFKQHFARGQAFSYDLTELGRYYSDYVKLMGHFETLELQPFFRVRHEDMVRDTEAQVRALLDACHLPFEPSTLRFWETERAVQTASSEQVRRPIFNNGLDQWRHYATWLAPLRSALGSAALAG